MSSATHMAVPAQAVAVTVDPGTASSHSSGSIDSPTVSSLPLGKRGHKRSVSLENNAPLPLRSTPSLCGMQQPQASPLLLQPCYTTGTLKSRNEQRRLSQKFGSHSNLDDDYGAAPHLRSKFQNIRQMFELSRSKAGEESSLQSLPATLVQTQPQQQPQPQQAQAQQPQVRRATPIAGNAGLMRAGREHLTISEQQQQHNAGEPMEQTAGNFVRPIAFKPIPFEPDYRIAQQPTQQHQQHQQHQQQQHQHLELPSDRYGYGSTPSLAPVQAATHKFGSTSDLRHGSALAAPTATAHGSALGLVGGYNAYGNSLAARRRGYRAALRSSNDDSLESIGQAQEGAGSKATAINGNNNNKYQCELTPSPSDSGISELEAALKDRDSELSYLRQAMEQNEKVIFKVQKDKEVFWEHETQRLKFYYESQQREYLLKFKKMEQLLALQQFQLKQHKLRHTEQLQKLREQLGGMQQQLELDRANNKSLKQSELQLQDTTACLNQQLGEAHQALDTLRTQLEDSEWKVCERNGEIALLKTQLKEAHLEINLKDHAIVNLKQSNNHNNSNNRNINNNQNCEKTSTYQSQPKPNAPSPEQEQQLHKIIALKDQVIGALTNELAKLRKELSDLAIAHEYGEEPCGRYTRLKQQLDNLNEICQRTRKYTQAAAAPASAPQLDAIMQRLQLALNLGEDKQSQQTLDTLIEEFTTYAEDIAKLRQKLDDLSLNLEQEKRQWCAEALSHQKKLQAYYIRIQKLRCLDNATAAAATGAAVGLGTVGVPTAAAANVS